MGNRQVIREAALSNISRRSVLVAGGSFGGLTACFGIQKHGIYNGPRGPDKP